MKSRSDSNVCRCPVLLVVLLALALCPVGLRQAAAADIRVPNIGSAIQESQSARPMPQPKQEQPDIVKQNGQAAPGDQNGPTIFVKDFKLENVEYLPEADIQKVLEPFKNRQLTMAQLEEATRAVTDLYRKKGYTVAKAYLPKQSIAEGIVVIRILVGTYSPSSSENKSLVRDWLINKSLASNLPEGEPVRRSDLERAVLLIADMPGAGMPTLNIGPGQQPGTTEVFTQVPKGKRFSGYLMGDNMGSRYTGRLRFGGGIDVNSPFGIADKLSVYSLVTGTTGLVNYGGEYAFPLSPNGLRLALGYSHVYYELGQEFKDLDASGSADIFQATVTYPLIRSGARNLSLYLNAAHKAMGNNYAAFDVMKNTESSVGKVGLVYETWTTLLGRPLYTRLGGYVTGGQLYYMSGEDYDSRETEGWFSYGSLEFLSSLSLTEHWSLTASGNGQQAFGKNLDSSEQIIVTGLRGVKAYSENVSGDNGYTLNAELKYKLPNILKWEHALGGFIDYGEWSYERAPFPDPHSGDMTDIGLGYYAKFGLFSGKVQLVQGLGDYPTGLKKESQTVVCTTLMLSF